MSGRVEALDPILTAILILLPTKLTPEKDGADGLVGVVTDQDEEEEFEEVSVFVEEFSLFVFPLFWLLFGDVSLDINSQGHHFVVSALDILKFVNAWN